MSNCTSTSSSTTFPYDNIPPDGALVDDLALYDAGMPLLRGATALLQSLSHVHVREQLEAEYVGDALSLVAAQIQTVTDLLRRWGHARDVA